MSPSDLREQNQSILEAETHSKVPGHSCYGCLVVAFIFAGGDGSVRPLHMPTTEGSLSKSPVECTE